jgi:hypothetical protein
MERRKQKNALIRKLANWFTLTTRKRSPPFKDSGTIKVFPQINATLNVTIELQLML